MNKKEEQKKHWKEKDKFRLIKATELSKILDGTEPELPTSDLCITENGMVLQYEYIPEDERPVSKIQVKPGIFTMMKSPFGMQLQPTDFTSGNALESIDNTARIKKEVNIFFSKLAIYDELQLPKKRAILLYGPAGTGKTFSVKKTIQGVIADDPGTTVLIWPTSELHAEEVATFLSFAAEYTDDVNKVILIMEDIGGGEQESGALRSVGSGMLQLLDGVNVSFRKPTFIIATTNHPENLLANLADRPGRFDQLIEIPPPPISEKIELMEFISKRQLDTAEKEAFYMKGAEFLSIAHLKEIVTRTRLHDKTISEVIREMIDHNEKFNTGFTKKGKVGLGF